MTINIADNSPRISYSVASGVTQTSFAVPFEFFDDEDLNVYVDGVEKTLTTDFTVSGGDGSTGTVTISVTGASGGSTVVITRDIPLERTTDFPVSGAFNIVALNTELDRLVAVAADLNDLASRAITPLDYDPTVSYTLPTVDNRKGKTLAFNEVTGSVQAGPSIADTQSVADASADIALLADIQDGTVATNAITTAANVSSQIATLGAISSDITTVSGISSNVTTVAGNDANVTTVAGISSNVTTVADNIADINTVADDLNEVVSEINTVATDITNVNTVGTNITNVNTTAGSINNVNTVASDITNVNTVSTNISNVNTVAGISANVTTVAGQTTNLQNVTDNLTAIQNAASNATSASDSATAAAASAAAAALSADTFDDTYLGSKASDPSLDNDGDALNAGDLYFNTTSNTLKVYSGSAWQDAAVDSSGFVQTTGDTMTGNLSFGDSDKAIFGAGSDLQIYHNGSHSYIKDQGSGNLYLQASGQLRLQSSTGENYLLGNADGAVNLYYDNAQKFTTTSTGIDVTGTVTADGLTVAGRTVLNGSGFSTSLYALTVDTTFDRNGLEVLAGNSGIGKNIITAQNHDGTKTFFNVADSGDISFYEDTGTTAKFFWDASAERLGIGTSSPAANLQVSATAPVVKITSADGQNAILDLGNASDPDGGRIVYGAAEALAFYTTSSERLRIDSSGNVGIGTSSPTAVSTYKVVQVTGGTTTTGGLLRLETSNASHVGRVYVDSSGTVFEATTTTDPMLFRTNNGERMRIDSSGNLLVGTTDSIPWNNSAGSSADNGFAYRPEGILSVAGYNTQTMLLNRTGTDGDIAEFRKDGSTVGRIGSRSGGGITTSYIQFNAGSGDDVGLGGTASKAVLPILNGSISDNMIDLGVPTVRFDDVYATNGTIQTSDRNEKQDIAELSDAEQRVAVAAKGLLRKFRWRDAVAEKGDKARTHFGIIAQDLQAAFVAEGLDAGDYAMFIHSTWTDEETGEERSRMGVRYSELLAFIIAAI